MKKSVYRVCAILILWHKISPDTVPAKQVFVRSTNLPFVFLIAWQYMGFDGEYPKKLTKVENMKKFLKITLIVLIVLLLLVCIGWITGATSLTADLVIITDALKGIVDVVNMPLMFLGDFIGVEWLSTIFEWFPIGWISQGLGAIGGLL